jgi:hypothetical protein
LSEYKLAACAGPSQAAILETTSVVYKLEIALLLTSVESSAISLWGGGHFLSSGLFVDTYSSRGHSGSSSVRFQKLFVRPRKNLVIE